jgi:hypothetical protein
MSTSDRPGLEQLTDLCTPWYVHTVATLRIAEHMAAGEHPAGRGLVVECQPTGG